MDKTFDYQNLPRSDTARIGGGAILGTPTKSYIPGVVSAQFRSDSKGGKGNLIIQQVFSSEMNENINYEIIDNKKLALI